jgi:hypothetical protein
VLRLVGSKFVGSEVRSGGAKMSRSERKNQGAAETARANAEFRAGATVFAAVVILVIASFIFQARGAGGPPSQPIETIAPTDTSTLREALFGAAPWVIQCSPSSGESVLRAAAQKRLLPEGLRVASLACDQPMASGATLLERFDHLDAAAAASKSAGRPLLLLSGHGLPAPISAGKHTSASSLVRHLKRWVQPHIPLVNNTLDLRRHCLSRRACLVLLTTGTAPLGSLSALLKVVGNAHREIGVVTINRRTHTASFSAQLPDSATRPVLMAIRPSVGSHSLMVEGRAFKGVVNSDSQLDLEAFVATVAKGSGGGFTELAAAPRVAHVDATMRTTDDMKSEELVDPLLSSKRYDQETTL